MRGVSTTFCCSTSPHLTLPDLFFALRHRYRRGWDGRHFDVGRARLRVLGLAPPGEIIAQEIIGRSLGQGMDVGSDAPVHFHVQVEGLFGVLGIGQRKARLAFALADEGMLVGLRNRQSGDDEGRTGRNHFHRFDLAVGMGVPPGPEEVPPGIVARDFRLALARVAPVVPRVTPHLHRAPVREGDKRLAAQGDVGDFETFANGNAYHLSARQPEHVVRHGNPQWSALHKIGFQQAVGEDQAGGSTVDGNGDTAGGAIERDEAFRRVVIYPEGQAAAQLVADGRVGFFLQDIQTGVAQGGQVEGQVVWHGAPLSVSK